MHWKDSKAGVDREHSAHKDGRIGTAASCGLVICYWAGWYINCSVYNNMLDPGSSNVIC